MTRSSSLASPSATVISISGKFVSVAAPGPNPPPDSSRVRLSSVPAPPVMEMESVLVVVAAPHAVGVAPKWSAPPTTTSVASPLRSMVAVTAFVPALYEQDSAAASAGKTAMTKKIAPVRTTIRMCALGGRTVLRAATDIGQYPWVRLGATRGSPVRPRV